MSETIKDILKYCPYIEPEETEFYTMIRRGSSYQVECSTRNGYTVDLEEFGVFSRDKAFSNVRYMDGNGCLRFNIEKNLFDNFVSKIQQLEKENAELKDICSNADIEASIFKENKKLKKENKILASALLGTIEIIAVSVEADRFVGKNTKQLSEIEQAIKLAREIVNKEQESERA